MTRRRTRKNMRKNAKRIFSTIERIPIGIASDIMARVAANSLTDIANVKLSCKVLKEIAEDPYVYQKASLKKFPVVHWWPPTKEEKTFLDKCLESRNPELLYRRGVLDYFSRKQFNSALGYLKNAAKLGHVQAFYVIGIILLLSMGKYKSMGIAIVSEMKKSRTLRREIKNCRRNLLDTLSMTWEKRSAGINRSECCAQHVIKQHMIKRGWDPLDIEDEDLLCDACTCDTELYLLFDATIY